MRRLYSIVILSTICSLVNGQQIAEIIEYTPAPGQFINTSMGSPEAAESLLNESGGLVSLGGYGGYIVLNFIEPLSNHPDNPYGVDFTIFGNAFSFWSEPGIVAVMKDENENGLPDETWYELAGSDHFFPNTIPDYLVTYTNPFSEKAADVHWGDNQGVTGLIKKNVFQNQPYYPDPSVFLSIGESECKFTGRRIMPVLDFSNPQQGVSYSRSFGYADNNVRIDPQNSLPDNPYTTEVENSGGDAMDIAWAIDESGQYVELDKIDFLKIYTSVNADGGILGELSTEISLIKDVNPSVGYPIIEKFISVKGLPSKIIPDAYALEYSVFFGGRYDEDETVTWTVSESDSRIEDNYYLVADSPEQLTLTATLDSDPSVNTSFTTEVYMPDSKSLIPEAEISIYPNPASDFIIIEGAKQGKIELISSLGKVVFEGDSEAGIIHINVNTYPEGLYFLRVRETNKTKNYKFIIQR